MSIAIGVLIIAVTIVVMSLYIVKSIENLGHLMCQHKESFNDGNYIVCKDCHKLLHKLDRDL